MLNTISGVDPINPKIRLWNWFPPKPLKMVGAELGTGLLFTDIELTLLNGLGPEVSPGLLMDSTLL